jgi:hypothetical protein
MSYFVQATSKQEEGKMVHYQSVGMMVEGTFWCLRHFETMEQACEFIHYLNGGMLRLDTDRLVRSVDTIAERLDRIWRTMPR